ncbi:SUKH-4 family immunity protein [Streptomyces chromofuscus]|uniref:SUKH-4 family immunity protein n=1 Tax=Streptomyces chromofuscus TaxID=42881 RepID=A0A7M2TG09_STRCW|nr:SUKH-4 family immunity protein [Streptomyces chromofuscus]QOV47089.1 SUKH-4 family immunity protein [Streptomyces chromofuscus]GGT26267.1 hypothetical protein GCM10010254_53410 [Streptomyces chromofuscus]
MVTFAQAQERAEEWINGDVPSYQHREVRVREFELGFVVWAEDRADGPRSDGGAQRLVIARDSGEATLWPSLPVGEVVRRYEEEYGRPEAVPEQVSAPAERVDLNQTSFLLSPPEWLQEAADRLGISDRRGGGSAAGGGGTGAVAASGSDSASGAGVGGSGDWPAAAGSGVGGGSGASGAPGAPAGATPWAGTDTNADAGEDRSVPLPATVFAPPLSEADEEESRVAPPEAQTALMSGGSRLPPTAIAPVVDQAGAPGAGAVPGGASTGGTPAQAPLAPTYGYPQGVGGPGGEAAPGTPTPPAGAATPPSGAGMATPPPGPGTPPPGVPGAPGAPGVPQPSAVPQPPAAPQPPAGPGRPLAPNAGDIADAATSKAAPPPRRAHGGDATPPPPPGAPGTPGARPGSTPPPPGTPGAPGSQGASAGAYVPTQLVSALGPDGPGGPEGGPGVPQAPGAPTPPGPPTPPGTPGGPGTPPGGVHHAATMLADPGQTGPGRRAPQPPGAPGAQGSAGGAHGAVHHAETMLAGPPVGAPGTPPPPQAPGAPGAPGTPPGVPHPMPHAPGAVQPHPGPLAPGPQSVPGQPVPGQPPAYGYPQQVQPTVGPGYQAVLRYRAQDGSEQQLIRRSAPGTPHPEWQIFHELRAMNVPPDQVLELHTELESCELPGAYCARMIREQWPQARITSIAPYGTDHASRQQGMGQLLVHQGELHQVADGPARPAPVRAPLPPVQPAPPLPPEGVAQELAGAFGPGVFRFEQAAVSRQGVPPVVAHTLVVAGLPLDMGPFFWAQAQPGRPVPTLAELAQERGVQPASDAGSYLVMGSDFGKAICVQYGTAHIVAVPVEAGPGGAPVPPQFVNTGLPEFVRCLALLGRMWRLRFGLNQEQAGRWTVDFQAQLASLDPAALGSPESWWSVLLEQMWDGLL